MRKISSPHPLPLCLLPEIPHQRTTPAKNSQIPWAVLEILLILMGTAALLPAVPYTIAASSMGLWVLLATIYVLVTLGQARTQRLIPDQAAILDASTTWHPRLVILLACTPPIAGFMGLSGGLIGLLTPADIVASSPELMKIASPEALKYIGYGRTTIAVTMAILGWFVLYLGYARHYQRLATSDGYDLEVPGSRDATAPAGKRSPASSTEKNTPPQEGE